jgi:PAS domain S-box-containing protein
MNKNKDIAIDFPLDPFFDDVDDLLCIAGYDGFFKKVNPAVIRLLGYSEEELYSRSIKTFIHPEDQDRTWDHRQNRIKGKAPGKFINRYITKTGKTVWLSWSSIPVESQEVMYAIAKNITPLKEKETERNVLIENLSEINKNLKNLSYTTSHDLRTPVNNLLAVFSLLDTSKIKDKETLEFIDILKTATDGLKNTLNNYMDILNEKNLIRAKISSVNLKEIVHNVINSVSSLIENTDTKITVTISDELSVQFNEENLKSVVLNLITNAIKYAHVDRTPKISIQAQDSDSGVILRVCDNGIGFDTEKNSGKIFGLNEKFHGENNPDSKGVGLYLVHNHITNMGGSISVESKVNIGTTFTITLRK